MRLESLVACHLEGLCPDKIYMHRMLKQLAPMRSYMLGLVEPAMFKVVLEYTKGNQMRAAQILGMNRNSLLNKLNKYQLTDFARTKRKEAKW